MDIEAPARHIQEHYKRDDWLCAALLKRDPKGGPPTMTQEFDTAQRMISPARLAHWRAANANGTDIYLGVNAFHDGVLSRKREDVKAVRHIYLDVDKNGPDVLKSVLEDKSIPKPSTVIQSSPGKYHLFWRVEMFSPALAEGTVRGMAQKYGADEAVFDNARILRLPGFANNKYKEKVWVSEVPGERSPGILNPTNFPQFPAVERTAADDRRILPPGHNSRSENDWARVLDKLKAGEDPATVRAWLQAERPDKQDPVDYSERTVKNALIELSRRPQSRGHRMGR